MTPRKIKCPFCNKVSSVCCETKSQADKCVKMTWGKNGFILLGLWTLVVIILLAL